MNNFPDQINFAGYDLHIIPATFEMASTIYNIFSADMDRLSFFSSRSYDSVENVFIKYMRRAGIRNAHVYGIFKDGELLGEIGFNGFTSFENKCGVLGYWVKKEARDRGVISTLMPEILRIGFEDMGFESIVIECSSQNGASRHIAEKFGFCLDGILRRRQIFANGTVHDECVYSKLKSEWEKENKNA